VAAQIDAVFAGFAVAAVKTGMLFSADLVEVVAQRLAYYRPRWLVVDPVMVASSGAKLLRADAVEALEARLLPLASLITPNLPETEVLLGHPVPTEAAAVQAALDLARRYGCWVVVKGGHGGGERALDVLAHAGDAWLLSSPREAAPTSHGTGCGLSAALAACLARGDAPAEALRQAKAYVLGRLRACRRVGSDTWVMVPPGALPVHEILLTACPRP
jgi:hydroxymethylpyrimidine kinase/phosphomethylpyrimidine kinase